MKFYVTVKKGKALEGQNQRSNTPSIRSPLVDEERMIPVHRLVSVLCVSFSALILVVGGRKDKLPVQHLCHLPLKVLFQNTSRKITSGTS